MTKKEALDILEKMSSKEYQQFCEKLPNRVQLLLKAGFVSWREVLPEWYIRINKKN
jgi:hypothetical protein